MGSYANTTFFQYSNAKAGEWAEKLKELRSKPEWQSLMSWGPGYGIMRYGLEVEVQIFDGGNQLTEGKGFKGDLPGLDAPKTWKPTMRCLRSSVTLGAHSTCRRLRPRGSSSLPSSTRPMIG